MPALLVTTVCVPVLGALVLLVQARSHYRHARWVALAFALTTLALSLILAVGFRSDVRGPQFASAVTATHNGHAITEYGPAWLTFGDVSIRFGLGLDGISLWLFVLTAVLSITALFSSWESITERAAAHYALILMLETGMLGLFASLDVVLFYIFFEFTLIPLFFLIGIYGGPERRRAAVTFFLYTLAGSLLTLVGVLALVVIHQQFSPGNALTFSIPALTDGLAQLRWRGWSGAATTQWTSPQTLVFLLLFAGFAIKVPLFPFHTWLPLAHVEAPTAGSVLLAGVLLKVGSYGFLRFNLAMTPHGAAFLMPMLVAMSVIGIIYGALTALAQTDVKRLVAYSSVSHMGFITLGLFSLTATGVDGAMMQMINHGVTTGALFACVGVFYERYHTREMSELGGLWERLPALAFFFILASLGSAAVPGLNGFVGEFPILVGMFSRDPVWAVLGTTGMILGPYYLFTMLQRTVFGPLHEPAHHSAHSAGHDGHAADSSKPSGIRPVGWHEIAGLAPLMALIVVLGVYPKPVFEHIRPAVGPIAARFPAAEAGLYPVDASPITRDVARVEPISQDRKK